MPFNGHFYCLLEIIRLSLPFLLSQTLLPLANKLISAIFWDSIGWCDGASVFVLKGTENKPWCGMYGRGFLFKVIKMLLMGK